MYAQNYIVSIINQIQYYAPTHSTTPLAHTFTKRRKICLMLLCNRSGSLSKHSHMSKLDGQPSKKRHMQCIMLYKSQRICSEVQIIRTDHNNLLFMNGSRKSVELLKNFHPLNTSKVQITPADVFSRLVPRIGLIVNDIVLSRCTTRQHYLIKACYEDNYAHCGVHNTLNLLKS